MRVLGRVQWVPGLWLTVVWVLLWGNVSVANVVAGALLAVFILSVFPLPSLAVGVTVRPVALTVLLVRFFADMTIASAQVAWLALRPGRTARGLVVDLHLRGRNELFQTITAEMVALVPGSIVIDLDSATGTLTLHVLDVRTRQEAERVRHTVLAQEARVLRALDPDPEAVLDPRRRRQAELGGAP
ncbi:MAG: Na+/H+ antiporter subunit E [Actinobacteria bacterium]|nr:Na+/H+ antiporter subunit E [Actinomycetota bacterium]